MRVGVPQEQTIPGSEPAFFNNVMVGGGPAPVRAYIEELSPDVLDGRINPGRTGFSWRGEREPCFARPQSLDLSVIFSETLF